MRYFAGINLSGIIPEVNPHMPGHWNSLAFRICHRNIWYDLEITQKGVKVRARGKVKKPVLIKVYEKEIRLTPGKKRTVKK